jgi:small subunit ribosomal protein S1
MANPSIPESQAKTESGESGVSFNDILSQYEQSHSHKSAEGKGREGTVVAITADSVLLDIGFKTEGILPLAAFQSAGETVKPGDKLLITIKGRDPEGYYELSRARVERPKDWSSLERAFAEKATIEGTVTGVVKGGLSVDIGVRAFMPASRSGVRDAAEMENLAEQEERAIKERRYSEVKEGETVSGVVRSLTDYGAFVDIGGVDALLHVADISWGRVNKPADMLAVGEQIEVKVLKVDPDKRRISVGLKHLQPQPWDTAPEKYRVGERVRGAVTRVVEFGAFVELEPGIEGLIHLSEMSWAKKVRKPSDVVKPGETVEAVILGVNTGERRISLGLKQALGDPWVDVALKFPAGSVVQGPVTSITKFGAFVQLAEGVEGMIHVSEISAEKRINHPQDVLRMGQIVQAQVLEIDKEKRQLRLSIKQMVPSSLDEYIAEHKQGDVVTGRMVDVSGGYARVELGEGVQGTCPMPSGVASEKATEKTTSGAQKADLSSLSSMLTARWKGGSSTGGIAKRESAQTGQIRSFRIAKLDPAAKKIELELAE